MINASSKGAKMNLMFTDQERSRIEKELSRIPCGVSNIDQIYEYLELSLELPEEDILEFLLNELTPDIILTNEIMDGRQILSAVRMIFEKIGISVDHTHGIQIQNKIMNVVFAEGPILIQKSLKMLHGNAD